MNLDGLLIVDKPSGPTSFDVVKRLRGLATGKKAGHIGTLDPLASGVLPLCLGEGTKIAAFIGEGEKVYEGVVKLGVATDTLDSQGKVLATRPTDGLKIREVEAAVAGFLGEYWQTPPMFSAAKVGGKRLYELARQGQEVERRPRKVVIHEISLLRFDHGRAEATIHVRCGKGTYIRSIAQELGEALGVGGHLSALRRLRNSVFGIERAVPLAVLLDLSASGKREELCKLLIPLREALPELPEVIVDAARAEKVSHGMALGARELRECNAPRIEEGAKVRVVGADGRLLAVGELQGGSLRYPRVLAG